jgi:hypothetical protein
MTKARNIANLASDGSALADGTINYTDVSGTPTLATVATTGAYADVTGTPAAALPLAGGTLTGNVNLGDNVKANFGAGSDLQIYHTGAQSFISDQGTGPLIVLASALSINNAANTEIMLDAYGDGAVTLYNNGAAKLATSATGVTVTGTVAATAYTGDGSALTGIVTGSLTLLGTLTTTSGTTQTLSGLTLTSYKQIYAVVNKVSGTSASSVSLRLNSVSGPYISPEQSPTQEWSGTCYIDLTSGIVAGVISVYAAGTTDGNPSNDRVYKSVQTTVTTAATSITFAIAGGNFDLGTITVYGVQ